MDVVGSEFISELRVYLLSVLSGIDTDAVVPFFKTVNDRQCLTFERRYPFLHCFWVIVSPSTGFGSFGHAIDERLGRTVEVDEVSNDDLIRELFLENIPIFLVSGEAVEQIPAIAVS